MVTTRADKGQIYEIEERQWHTLPGNADQAGRRSVNWKRPLRSTRWPVRPGTGVGSTGPAETDVCNSPFSPHGSTPVGKSLPKVWSKTRPPKDAYSIVES